jgi:membrane protein DedA with SNARE-associated domain
VEQTLLDWLARFGPPVLFFAQIFGIFGVPVPDELLLTLAGVLVREGALSAPATVAATFAGCAGGITLSFVLGRTVGVAALHHRALRAHRAALGRAERWFERFGVWLLAFGYFVPGVRHVSAITAGSASLEYRTFAAAAYPGAVLWCSLYLGLGYFGGEHWPAIAARLPGRLSTTGFAVGAAIVIYLVTTRRRRRPGRMMGGDERDGRDEC